MAQGVEGYFHRDEGRLLFETAVSALTHFPDHAIVELGSYCGKSTVILGKAVQWHGGHSKVYAIDPHEGEMMFPEGLQRHPSTLSRFMKNIDLCGVVAAVKLIQKRSFEVAWDKPIGLLFIDALHDYENVSRDFKHFSGSIVGGGRVAFHDYELNDHPGVTRRVNELLAGPDFIKEKQVDSLIVLRKIR